MTRDVSLRLSLSFFLCLAVGALAGCADEDPSPGGEADVTVDTGPDGDPADGGASDADAMGDVPGGDEGPGSDAADAGPDLPPEPAALPTQAPLMVPADPLAGTGVESCALYEEERCEGGTLRRCEVYDTTTSDWVDEPDELLRRVFLFDRWRDLYNSPDGQAIDRTFVGEVLPGTPEAEWGDPANHEAYWGAGDGGIWTGWSTVATVLRYAITGTEADYARMEQQVRDMVTMYEVTGIPGYVVRTHYLLLPEGAPNTPDHNLRWEGSYNPNHHHRAIVDPASIDNLPAAYTEGITDADGKVWLGTPMWQGRPSIDQNTGPMTSLPLAWDLIRDDDLKDRITHNLTCYLKRLQRIEITNLQSSPELMDALMSYFNSGELNLDVGDVDLTKIDRIVGYVHRQINTKNEATFDTSCPDTVQLEPWRVIDSGSDTFTLDVLNLVQDMNVSGERPETIDHYYFPNVRGADAMHMMHLATMAYHFTGDEQYRTFLNEELLGNLGAVDVLHTAGAFDLPKYCKKYYADQITFGPWWGFLHLLGDSELKGHLEAAFHVEMWDKLMRSAANADFEIMYAGALGPEKAPDFEMARDRGLETLGWMGGNGGALMGDASDRAWLADPRRSYTVTHEQVMAVAGDGVTAECPTESEVATCTAEVDFLGVKLPNLTGWEEFDCTGSEWECDLGEGRCTDKMTSEALPIHVRAYSDYIWQRNPFELGRFVATEGRTQFAGSDVATPYWNARRYGFISDGAGQVLAWREGGACESP